jgi:excisionase family DNA binding protein
MSARPTLAVAMRGAASGGESPPLERHFGVDELVAAGIAPTRATAWAWCRQQKIRHVRLGRSLLIPESAVREFLAKHAVEASR